MTFHRHSIDKQLLKFFFADNDILQPQLLCAEYVLLICSGNNHMQNSHPVDDNQTKMWDITWQRENEWLFPG